VSWWIGFERNATGSIGDVADPEARVLLSEHAGTTARIEELSGEIAAKSAELKTLLKEHGELSHEVVTLNYVLELLKLQLKGREKENRRRTRAIRSFVLERVPGADGKPAQFYVKGRVPPGENTDGRRWRIADVSKAGLKLAGGGEVVGTVLKGLPSFNLPEFSFGMLGSLLSATIVISLVGFMEAISIAKAMAAKTKQKIDPNQELIGQGLANIVGSMSQSFPVSGSFSRSAVNINAGAITGMSSVFTGLFVLLTLLFLTPLLYHMPQAALAAVIIMAVVGLVNFPAMKHAWQVSRHDGMAAIITFVATLAFAPHLDTGILFGAGLAVALYLLRTMKPRVAILGRHPDGSLRDARVHSLPGSEVVTAVRFDGRLYFANVSYFEDIILEAVAGNPKARFLLVVGNGINELDASGEEVMRHVVQRLRANGITVVFSGLKKQVIDVMRKTALLGHVEETWLFPTSEMALEAIYAEAKATGIKDALSPLKQS
jgi:SulP family sulfate permease